MAVHDWTRVSPGTFHDFHCVWIAELRNRLNTGVLPKEYYAQAEQIAGAVTPDVLTLHHIENGSRGPSNGGTAVAVAPPKVLITKSLELDLYAAKQRRIVIRHSSDDRIVALLEILSRGNKSHDRAFQAFLDEAIAALSQGYHLLLVDLFPPTPRDPEGIHAALWAELGGDAHELLPDKPLTLVAYEAGLTKTAYVQPVAVGDTLPDMPLFLEPGWYVNVPLEAAYSAAYRGVPDRWRRVLDGP